MSCRISRKKNDEKSKYSQNKEIKAEKTIKSIRRNKIKLKFIYKKKRKYDAKIDYFLEIIFLSYESYQDIFTNDNFIKLMRTPIFNNPAEKQIIMPYNSLIYFKRTDSFIKLTVMFKFAIRL